MRNPHGVPPRTTAAFLATANFRTIYRTLHQGLFPATVHLAEVACLPPLRVAALCRCTLLLCASCRQVSGLHSVCEFVCRHGGCLLTKEAASNTGTVQNGRKSQTCCQYSMQTQGVPNSTFQGLSEYTPHTPPSPEHSVGTNEATRAPTHENPQSWHKRRHPREICVLYFGRFLSPVNRSFRISIQT